MIYRYNNILRPVHDPTTPPATPLRPPRRPPGPKSGWVATPQLPRIDGYASLLMSQISNPLQTPWNYKLTIGMDLIYILNLIYSASSVPPNPQSVLIITIPKF